jgi:alpha-tubulin suppressor-like RCC1 family protein
MKLYLTALRKKMIKNFNIIRKWLFLTSIVLFVLTQPVISNASEVVIQLFEGLPDTYNGEADENWQGHQYLAEYFQDNATVNIGTLGIRTINGEKYICTGWKNGLGSINPKTGDKNHITVTMNSQSSLTWIYKKAYELTFDINNFQQTLWAWGINWRGQLGNGTTDPSYQPIKPQNTDIVTDWISIAANWFTSWAVRKDGTLWYWGQSGGQNVPVTTPIQVGTEDNWIFVVCGDRFAIALKKDGTLWRWDEFSTTPVAINTDSDWVLVDAGVGYVLAIKNDGSLWSWGNNWDGQLGHGDKVSVNQPKQVGTDTDWADVSALNVHSLALKKDGTLWAWGSNLLGQVGDYSYTDVLTPKEIAPGTTWKAICKGNGDTSAAIRIDGTLWTWGKTSALGRPWGNEVGYPVQVGNDKNWISLSQGAIQHDGGEFIIGLKSDGHMFAWGDNHSGQLGLGNNVPAWVETPVQVGTDDDWIFVATGAVHTIALKSPNRIRYNFRPHFGPRLLPQGELITAYAAFQVFDDDSDYLLTSWENGYGDIESDGCAEKISFELSNDSGLIWQYNDGAPIVDRTLTVGLAPGVPSQLGDTQGFSPEIGTKKMTGSCLSLSAPAEAVIPGTQDRWLCTGWTGTGVTPDSGSDHTINISNPADIGPEVSIQWIYVIETDLPPSLTIGIDNNADWIDANVKISESGDITGSWTPEKEIGDHNNIILVEQDSTVKLSCAFGFVTNTDTYKCVGITVNTPGYSMPISKYINGDRMEFIMTLRQSLDITIKYSKTNEVDLGSFIPVPNGSTINTWTDTTWQDHLPAFEGGHPADTKDNAFFWDNKNKKLYPVRPTPYFEVAWDATGVGTPYQAVWSEPGQGGIIANTPTDLQPGTSNYTFKAIHISESYEYETWILQDNIFLPPKAGRSLLRFSDNNENPIFLVVEAIDFKSPETVEASIIGTAISETTHTDPDGKNGYVYNELSPFDGNGDNKAYDRSTRKGQIISVNMDNAADPGDDMVIAWYKLGVTSVASQIGWPVTLKRYDCKWPVDPETIVIASGNGSNALPEYKLNGMIYYQGDKTTPGYNPNEEHALIIGNAVYALRNDLNTYQDQNNEWIGPLKADEATTSEPYVLLKYKEPVTEKWAMDVYKVLAEDNENTFSYSVLAGKSITPLTPMDLLPLSVNSQIYSGKSHHHRDHKGGHWAKSKSVTGPVVMHWHYPLQSGFYTPDVTKIPGDDVPFMSYYKSGVGTVATNVEYHVTWPLDIPILRIGETLTTAKFGLPNVTAMAKAKIIYDEKGTETLAKLIDPYSERWTSLDEIYSKIRTESKGGKIYFPDLPYSLESRLLFDPFAADPVTGVTGRLIFKGVTVETGIGESLLLPNIMSEREKQRIKDLANANQTWKNAVDSLFKKTRAASSPTADGPFALTAGMAQSQGVIVLAENDDSSLGTAPVQLHVIRVEGGPVQGDIKVIKSDNPFDEKLTLRHSSDFGGRPENVYFKWYYKPDSNGIPPRFPADDPALENWIPFGDEGWGVNDITIEGAGKLTLSDNWFIVRYYYGDAYKALVAGNDTPTTQPNSPSEETSPDLKYWSPFAGSPGGETAQLAEGWIKRVVGGINPLDARVLDFRNIETNTDVSLLSQMGERYEGDIALNGSPENLNNIGLIEAYETILDRGKDFSIDGSVPVDYGPVNVALLNAATRIAGFYTLLGNEAYADAQDPTIAFDNIDGEQGSMASSLFAFRNQLDSLLEEELVLLRGRDDRLTTTRARPVYNKLIWNFTNGEGEIAYVQTYNLSDQDSSGVIDELDAKTMYPQGHGDSWGHYLTAMTSWYKLLKHPYYTWEPRVEAVLVGGAPVPVDYLDERKFAETAAAKARAGAEIVDLTYRKKYVADKSGQWQGYKDTDAERAWGVDEWARRSGQGAYFDWVTANAMLPSEDPNPSHEGIQKIDRTTVPELREIASQFRAIQQQADEADAGLNPLGLAQGVVPFDIDPTFLEVGSGMQGLTQFDQIYERALGALQNADNAFNFANRYTLLLRSNGDTIADFKRGITQQERDYHNRLIEIFGYPYAGDIGAGGTYPEGYDGPDLFHYMYMDSPELTGMDTLGNAVQSYTATCNFDTRWSWYETDSITTSVQTIDVTFPMDIDGPWIFKTQTSWGNRRAPGEIQMVLSDLISSQATYRQGLKEFDSILEQIQTATEILEARYKISKSQISIITQHNGHMIAQKTVAVELGILRSVLDSAGEFSYDLLDALSEGFPDVNGIDNDYTFAGVAAVKTIGSAIKGGLSLINNIVEFFEQNLYLAADILELERDRIVFIEDARFEVQQMAKELGTMHFEAESKVLELFTLAQAIQQTMGSFNAALAQGDRLLSERETFRKFMAGDVQEYRYQDWAFRTFRNDAVQKYRATFDLAARYAYLAATAYDYETNMLESDYAAGQYFLSEIVRRRSPGELTDGLPVAGSGGLSDPMARLSENFKVYESQLGMNNPQIETNRFSLKKELFRIRSGPASESIWKTELQQARITDLSTFPPFNRLCRRFAQDDSIPQPGLVLPFSTEITFGRNFFGWPLGGGDSSFDPSNFSTKIFGAGIKFDGYETAGLSNTPRVYLVPVGIDLQRTPSDDNFIIRKWQVVDQKLPIPYPISQADFDNPEMIPVNDLLSDEFRSIRKFSSFKAYFDGGDSFNAPEEILDLRLVGRSVWNTQWLLIIPGGTLLNDPNEGIDAFINNIDDIWLSLSTYSYSGN